MSVYAMLKFEMDERSWIAFFVDKPEVEGWGVTQEEALDNLRYQANKHELWPKERT